MIIVKQKYQDIVSRNILRLDTSEYPLYKAVGVLVEKYTPVED